jgi:hypothetical protein
MSAREVLLALGIALGVGLTGVWDGLVSYGFFRLVSSAF